MFEGYVFIRQEGERYLYRSSKSKCEWDLSIHKVNLDKYTSAGLPEPETAVTPQEER